jgi:hypothetical protein
MKYKLPIAGWLLSIIFCAPFNLFALSYLPDPTDVYDGLPAAILYDDFYSYNLWLLDELATNGPVDLEGSDSFTANAGVGGQDIVLYTQAGGTSNLGIGPDGDLNFEDPVNTNTGNSDGNYFDGYWGQDDQDNDGALDDVNGPVTVGQILDYLHAYNPDNDIPVFIFDINQSNIDWLWATGQVKLLDEVTGEVVESWAFDMLPDGEYTPGAQLPYTTSPGDGTDTGSWVYAPGTIDVEGDSGTVYSVDFSGSGFADYALYSQSMNLSLFDPNDLFVVEFQFDGLNNGGEEFFLTGATVPGDTPPEPVPEPSTLMLLGGGLLGLVFYVRRQR